MEELAPVSGIASPGVTTSLASITIPRLIGRDMQDEGSLRLSEAPAFLVRQDRGGGQIGYAVVIGEALGRRALMDLLYTLAPYKAHGPDRFARVLDNWHLHDRALTSSPSMNLFLQHAKSLKFSWQVFAKHRDLFMEILADDAEEKRALPVVTWERSPGAARRWHFDPLTPALAEVLEDSVPVLRDHGRTGKPEIDALVGLITIPYFLPGLRKHWQAWQPLVKNGKSNYIGPASVPVVALIHRRALLNSAFIRRAEEWIDSVASTSEDER